MSTEKIKGGYVLLARKIIDSELMNKPPHYLKLWVWMLGSAFWKDGDSLKRGQLLTTIAEMQEAGGYYVGARKKVLTRDEVRSCYEAFSKASMITTAKTTRGMVITINNFDTYQNFSSYEGHGEPHGENRPKATGTPHDRENSNKTGKNSKPSSPPPPLGEGKEEKPEKVEVSFSEPVMWIAHKLADLILQNNPKNRELQDAKKEATVLRWAKDIDKMIRLDKREAREVATVVLWCQQDSFWSQNILSGATLRAQYDKLILKMKGTALAVVPPKAAKETRLDRNVQAVIDAGRMLGVFDGEE